MRLHSIQNCYAGAGGAPKHQHHFLHAPHAGGQGASNHLSSGALVLTFAPGASNKIAFSTHHYYLATTYMGGKKIVNHNCLLDKKLL